MSMIYSHQSYFVGNQIHNWKVLTRQSIRSLFDTWQMNRRIIIMLVNHSIGILIFPVQLVLSPPNPTDRKSLQIIPSAVLPFPNDWIFLPIELLYSTTKKQDPAPEDLALTIVQSILRVISQLESSQSQCKKIKDPLNICRYVQHQFRDQIVSVNEDLFDQYLNFFGRRSR
jgi:hypothetical protein